MKHKVYLFLPLFFLLNVLHLAGQNNEACTPPTAKEQLDINNIRATYRPSPHLWFDTAVPGYEIITPMPGKPPIKIEMVGGLWIAGKDPGNNLKIAANTFDPGNSDYWPGPLDVSTGLTDNSICQNFNRLWKVLGTEINSHLADFDDNGLIDGPVPVSILAWPGRNNPNSFSSNGFNLPVDQPLAPFVDRNDNGSYEPMLGDYPMIKGDQALWWVFNDEGGGAFHKETNGLALQNEIHALAYAFDDASDEILFNTTFLEFNIINRRLEKLDSIFVSLWIDFDLGYIVDDKVGCLPEERIAFAYSVQGVQNPDCFITPQDDCVDLPIMLVKQLDAPKNSIGEDVGFSSFIAYNHPFFGNPLPKLETTDPGFDFEYYNYMMGKWRNGADLTYGEDGFNPDNPPTNYMFPDSPADTSGWSMCTANLPAYEKRTLINAGPFSLLPGESTKVAYAIYPFFADSYPCPDINALVEIGDEIQAVYDAVTAVKTSHENLSSIHFYPNPMDMQGKLVLDDKRYFMQQVELYSMDGRLVKSFGTLHTKEFIIQRNALPAGLYFYKILLNDGQWHTGRIVIE